MVGRVPLRFAGEELDAYVQRLVAWLDQGGSGADASGQFGGVTFLYDSLGRPIVTPDGIFAYDAAGGIPVAPNLVTINTEHLVDAAITLAKMAEDSVGEDQLQVGAITAGKAVIGEAAILTAMIGDAQIVEAKIADLAVNNAKISNVSAGKLIAGTIGADQIFVGGPQLELNGQQTRIIVRDQQATPQTRVIIGDLGAGSTNFGISIFSAAGGELFTAAGLGGNTVGTTQIIDGAVVADKISVASLAAINANLGTITAGSIDAALVSVFNLNASNINTGTLNASVVNVTNINADNINTGTLNASVVSVTNINASNITTGTLDADTVNVTNLNAVNITAGFLNGNRIDDNTVIERMIAANAVVADKILAEAVTTAKLAALAVEADKIADNAVIADKIAANAVTAGKIAANAVTAGTIEAGAVVADKIGANAVIAEKIAAGAVIAGKIAANAVTADEIAAGAVTAGKISVAELSAISATIGQVQVGAGGHIRQGQTAFDTGVGFFLGGLSGTPVLSLGDSDGDKLTWDGSTLTVTGEIIGSDITGATITGTDIIGGTIEGSLFETTPGGGGLKVRVASSGADFSIRDDTTTHARLSGHGDGGEGPGAFGWIHGAATTVGGTDSGATWEVEQRLDGGFGIHSESELNSPAIVGRQNGTTIALEGRATTTHNNNHGARFINTATGGGSAAAGISDGGGGHALVAESGGISQFTGVHNGLVSRSATFELGDVLVLDQVLAVHDFEHVGRVVRRSTKALDPAVVGVFWRVFSFEVDDPEELEGHSDEQIDTWAEQFRNRKALRRAGAAFTEREIARLAAAARVRSNYRGVPAGLRSLPLDDVRALSVEYQQAKFAALGEGQVRVCGQGGPIKAGDLLCSSDVPGAAMRQPGRREPVWEEDDNGQPVFTGWRETQIAEPWTFAQAWADIDLAPGETALIPCGYGPWR